MSAKAHPRHAARGGGEIRPDDTESRAAVALTVAWMLACASTALALAVALGLRLIIILTPVAGRPHPFGNPAGVMVGVALLTGLICLLLTFLANRVRRTPPPRAITIAAIHIGLAPIALYAAVAFGLI